MNSTTRTVIFYLVVSLVIVIKSNAQCRGYEYIWDGQEIPEGFEFVKTYKIDSKGKYLPRMYIYNLDSGEYNFFTAGINPKAELSIEILTTKKEIISKSENKFGNMQFAIKTAGWYYFVFTSIKPCSQCDCAIAHLSQKEK